MTMETFPVSRPLSLSGLVARPLQFFHAAAQAYKFRREEMASLAVIRRMDAHMQSDIGVTHTGELRPTEALINSHPAVLATTMMARIRNR